MQQDISTTKITHYSSNILRSGVIESSKKVVDPGDEVECGFPRTSKIFTNMVSKILTRFLTKHNVLYQTSKHAAIPKNLQTRSFQLSTESGGIPSRPQKIRFGLVKVMFVLFPFIYFGAVMSREGAAWLEERDIFSPEDDD